MYGFRVSIAEEKRLEQRSEFIGTDSKKSAMQSCPEVAPHKPISGQIWTPFCTVNLDFPKVPVSYLLAKQHRIPVLPKNQQQPMKRMMDNPAVAQRSAWKKCEVRELAPDWKGGKLVPEIGQGSKLLTEKPNLSTLSLVMMMERRALEKIQLVTNLVRKFR